MLIDDRLIDNVTDFGDDPNNYHGSFIIRESAAKQNVRLIVRDKAGNITDTSGRRFLSECTYGFNEWITVSSNPIVRTWAWIRANVIKAVILVLAIAVSLISLIVFIKSHSKREA